MTPPAIAPLSSLNRSTSHSSPPARSTISALSPLYLRFISAICSLAPPDIEHRNCPYYINRIMIFFSKKKFVAICVPNEKSFWTAVFAIYSTFYPFWTWAGSFFSNPFHFPAKWRHREMVGTFLLRFCEKIEEKLENLTFRRPESHLTIPNCLPASK